MENQAEIYYQGYAVQAPHPVAANPLPPGTAPPQPPAPAASADVTSSGVPPLPPQAAAPPAPYGATYQAPPYGYVPPPADPWSSYPVPAADSYSYHSYPTNAYDYPGPGPGPGIGYGPSTGYGSGPGPGPGPGYSYQPYRQQEPFPYPHSYPVPPAPFMPLPPRGSDVASFRRKMPFGLQQNLRPKGRPFKQSKQNPRTGGKPFRRGNTVPNVEPRVFNGAFPGSVMAMHAQNMPPLWQNRGDGGFAAHASKRRRVNVDVRPMRKDDRRIGHMRSRPDWKKGKKKDSKSSEDGPEKSKDRKVERVPWTEAEVQEIQRDARRRVEDFLVTLSEMKNIRIAGSQDKSVGGESNRLTVHSIDEPAHPDCVDAHQTVCRDGASTVLINGPEPDNTDVADFKTGDELLPKVPNVVDSLPVDTLGSTRMNATQLDYSTLGSSDIAQVTGSVGDPVGHDEVKDDQKPVPEVASISDKPISRTDAEVREELTFEFFAKLLDENKGLRDVYIETCENGIFECFMCNKLLKKRYSSLVSLVTHAINVLRTKKLPEHRGYGRAICALLEWDPSNLPKVPQNIIPRFGPESALGNNVIATVGVLEPSQDVGDDKESESREEAAEPSQYVDNDKGSPPRGIVEVHPPDGDADGIPSKLAEESFEKQDLTAKGETVAGEDLESFDKDGKTEEEELCMVLEDAGEREQELAMILEGVEEVKNTEVEHREEMKNSDVEHIDGVEDMKNVEVEHIDGGSGQSVEAPVIDVVDV